MSITPRISVQADDFDIAHEIERLSRGRKDVGAVVTFTGRCRDEGGTLSALELEHYPGMAEAEIARIAAEAANRWNLLGLTVIHRYGKIPAGENIVLVAATSESRKASFEATDFLMDYLKSRAPFWKKEHRADERDGAWVAARESDEEALAAWRDEA